MNNIRRAYESVLRNTSYEAWADSQSQFNWADHRTLREAIRDAIGYSPEFAREVTILNLPSCPWYRPVCMKVRDDCLSVIFSWTSINKVYREGGRQP